MALDWIGTGMSVPHPRRLLDFAVSKTIWRGVILAVLHTSGERSSLVGTLTVPSPVSTSRVQVWQASSSEPLWTLAGSRGSSCVRHSGGRRSTPWQQPLVLRRGRELEWTCDLSGGLRMLPMQCLGLKSGEGDAMVRADVRTPAAVASKGSIRMGRGRKEVVGTLRGYDGFGGRTR